MKNTTVMMMRISKEVKYMKLYDVKIGQRFIFRGLKFIKISNHPVVAPQSKYPPNVILIDVDYSTIEYLNKKGHKCGIVSNADVTLIKDEID